MKTLKQVMGSISRDMLFLHGHITTMPELDAAAQRPARSAPRPTDDSNGAAPSKDRRKTCKA